MAIHPFHLASDCEGGVKTGLVISESNISCLFIVACPESLLLCSFSLVVVNRSYSLISVCRLLHFSCCKAQALGAWASVAASHRLSICSPQA